MSCVVIKHDPWRAYPDKKVTQRQISLLMEKYHLIGRLDDEGHYYLEPVPGSQPSSYLEDVIGIGMYGGNNEIMTFQHSAGYEEKALSIKKVASR